jgi:magnesium-transporting ATPase (P-type)
MAASSGESARIESWARCPLEELYSELKTGHNGLSNDEVDRRLGEYGPNILPEPKHVALSRKAIAQFKNLFNVLLFLAALLSFIIGWTSNDVSSVQMGFAILGVVVLSVLFSLFQERRAERAVEALRELVPANARVIRDGQLVQVPVSKLVPGDVLSLEEGDKIPADARLVSSYDVTVDLSTLTGESAPLARSADISLAAQKSQVTEYPNLIFAGTTVASGAGSAIVLETGSRTQFGRVVEMTRNVEEPLSPLQRQLNQTAKLNFVVAFGIGFLFLGIALLVLRLSPADSVLFMIGVIISLVPEGLQVTVTLSLALSSLAMSKRNVVVKRLSSVETLGSTSVICTDKTGTITEGQMTVRKVWMGGRVLDVSGDGYEPQGAIFLDGKKVTTSDRTDLRLLCEVAALDGRATLVPPLDRRKSRWTAIGDSTDAALLVLATKGGIQLKQAMVERPRIGMIPFESTRKMMTSVHRGNNGAITTYVKGAGLEIISRCKTAIWNEEIVPLTEQLAAGIRAQIDAFAREAYRVLALAVRDIPAEPEKYESEHIERELTFVGLVAILDPPRPDVARAVKRARNAGMRVIMMTGDHELTAEAIARKVGIISSPEHAVVTGYRLAAMSDVELTKVLETPEVVFARINPDQKLRIVRALRAMEETVAVTGDGVNDAPALLEADIGISMGITGTDVARESSDMVLLDDNFASIVNGTELGRSVFDNLKKFIAYVFSHNWAELVAFIAFVLLQTPLPLTVIMVLAIDLVMEIPPSLALTLEPPEPGIMDRPPRPKKSRLFDLTTLGRSFYLGTMIGVMAVFLCFFTWGQAGWSIGMSSVEDQTAYLKGTTIVMAAIIAGQLGALFAVRTNVDSIFTVSPLRNKWLLAGALAEIGILLMIVYVPPFQWIVRAAPLDPISWVFLYSFVPVIIVVEEIRKFILRRVVLPRRAAPSLAVPFPPTAEFATAMAAEVGTHAPFVERGPPLLLPLFMRPGEESAVAIAASLAEYSGSRLIVVRVFDPASSDAVQDELERRLMELAFAANIPYEFADVNPRGGASGVRAMAIALKEIADRAGSETVVIPVGRDVFAGGRATKAASWIQELSSRKLVLVRGSREGEEAARRRPQRILIPVLHDFHLQPFELAASISASLVVPDIDVVAARVIKLPPIVPIYSTYRPESLLDSERELSSLKKVVALPFFRSMRPKLLVVRDTARDLVDFAADRQIDAILMQGDWAEMRHGFLAQDEREIARRTKAAVIVTLPPT